MAAYSYWREYHILTAHCGRNVPVGVAKPCRPDEIAQVYRLLPFSTTVRRWAPRSALRTSVIGGGGGGGGANALAGGALITSLPIPAMVPTGAAGVAAKAPAGASAGVGAAASSWAASCAASGRPRSTAASATAGPSTLMVTFLDEATCGQDRRLSIGPGPLSNA